MYYLRILISSILLFSFSSELYAKIKIKYKIGKEIITNTDIINEKNYLIFLRPNLKNITDEEVFKISENSLIKEIIKEKEINQAFNELDNDLKSIIKNACEAENTRMISEFTAANIDAQEKLVKEHGAIIRNFPKDVFNLMMSLSKDVVSETAAEGKLNKKIYESWSEFKEKARQRAAFNEHGYTNLSNNS